MKPLHITEKQLEILVLLYRFRFLNRQQLQTMLNHRFHNRIRSWLSDMTKKRILNSTYSKKFGENTKPTVYFLDIKSRAILKGQKNINFSLLNKIYQEKKRSQYFREQSMFLADIFLNLEKVTKEAKGKIHFFTKTDLEDHKYLPRPLPDAYIALEENGETKRYFLEIVSEQIPRYAIRKRVAALVDFYLSDEWQEVTNHPFPKILVICPNDLTKGFLAKFIAQMLDSEEAGMSFYLTTQDVIKSQGVKPDIWEKVASYG